MRLRSKVTGLMALMLSGCGTLGGASFEPSRSSASQSDALSPGHLYQSKLLLTEDCRISEAPVPEALHERDKSVAGLLATSFFNVLPGLVSTGVDLMFSRVTEEAQTGVSRSETLVTNAGFYGARRSEVEALLPKNYCLTIVRGFFGAPISGKLENTPWSDVEINNLSLAAPPDLYIEYHIHYEANPGLFSLEPAYVEYRGTRSKGRAIRSRQEVAIAFDFLRSATDVDDAFSLSSFATIQMPAMELYPGSTLTDESLAGVTSGRFPLPEPSGPIKIVENDAEVLIFGETPITVTATVVEASDPTILAEFMSEAAPLVSQSLETQLGIAMQKLMDKKELN